jgi:hypothetical protein
MGEDDGVFLSTFSEGDATVMVDILEYLIVVNR